MRLDGGRPFPLTKFAEPLGDPRGANYPLPQGERWRRVCRSLLPGYDLSAVILDLSGVMSGLDPRIHQPCVRMARNSLRNPFPLTKFAEPLGEPRGANYPLPQGERGRRVRRFRLRPK